MKFLFIFSFCFLVIFLLTITTVRADEVPIDVSILDATDEYNPSPVGVFIDDQVGYAFYVDGSSDVVYSKITDGGTTWDAPVLLSPDKTWANVAVWYDRWTPGDTGGTKIHIVASETATDDVWYNYLDTGTDTLHGWVVTDTGASFAPFDGGPSITKSTDGYLFIVWFDSALRGRVLKSIDSGDSWSSITPATGLTDDDDHAQLLPLSGGDVLLILWDESATDILSNVWNETTDTWEGWVVIDGAIVTDTTYNAVFGASLYKSTGDIYLSYNNDVDATTGDIKAKKFTESTRTWSALTDIATDLAEAIDVKIAVDENNGDLYGIYIRGGRAGATTHVYYKISSDGGTNWGGETQLSATLDDLRYVRTNLMSNERIYAFWYNDDLNDILGNTVADLTPVSGDTQAPSWSNPQKNETTVYQNMLVNFTASWTDDYNLSGYVFSINQTGSWVNSSFTGFGGTSNVSQNITNITASPGTTVQWRFYANDTGNPSNWNQTDVQTFIVSFLYGSLNGTLISPTGTNDQPQNQTFLLKANVTCDGQAEAICGVVNGTLRYNATTSDPDTNVQGNSVYATPFYAIEINPQTCGSMDVDSPPCNLTWAVNTTGSIGSSYKLDVNFTSDDLNIASNKTDFTTINIISPTLSIAISDALTDVQFGSSLNPGTTNNIALNNSDNAYNITCDYPVGNCNISIKGNSNMVNGSNILGIGNVSWNQVNNPATEKVLTLDYNVINATLAHLATQLIYLWIDIPPGQTAGDYKGNFTIQGQPN